MYSSDSFWITTESIYLVSIVKTKMMHLVYDNSSGKTKRHDIFDQIKIYKKRLHRIYLKWCFHIRPLMIFIFWIFNQRLFSLAYTILSKRQIFYKHSTLSKSEINISLIQTHFLVLSLTTNGLKICLLDNYVSYLLGWQLLKEIALLHVCRHSHTDSLLWCLSLECHPTLNILL